MVKKRQIILTSIHNNISKSRNNFCFQKHNYILFLYRAHLVNIKKKNLTIIKLKIQKISSFFIYTKKEIPTAHIHFQTN